MEEINISKKEDNSSLFLLKLLFTNKIQKICKFCSVAKNKNNINYSFISKKYLLRNSKNYIKKLKKKEIENLLNRKTKTYIKYKEQLKYNCDYNLIEMYYNSKSKERNMKDLCQIYQFAVLKPKIKHSYFKSKIRKCVLTLKIKREEAFRELLQEFSFSRISNINLQVLDKFMKTKKKTIIISKKKNSGVLPSLSSISHDLNYPPFQSSISRVTFRQKLSSKSSLIKKDLSINVLDFPMDLSDFHRNSDILEKKKKQIMYNLKLRKKTSSLNKINHNPNLSSSINIDSILERAKLSEIKLKIPDDKIPIKKANLSSRKFYDFQNSNLRPTYKLIKKKRKYCTHRNLTLDLKRKTPPKVLKKNLKKFIKISNLEINNDKKIKVKKKKIKMMKNQKTKNTEKKIIIKVIKIKPKKKKTFLTKKLENLKIKNKTILPKLSTQKFLKNILNNKKKSLQEVLYPSLSLKNKKSNLKNTKKNLMKIPEKINLKKRKKKKEKEPDFHNFLYK